MIKVLIVDDSEVVCRILAKELSKASDIEVVGTALDPYMARDKIIELHPDVITLDLEMPRMDGLTFLRKLMCYHPLPVVVVSSQTPEGSEMALHALELGAVDVLGKPDLLHSADDFAKSLIGTIRVAAAAHCPDCAVPSRKAVQPAGPVSAKMPSTGCRILAVGASTGGTDAIKQLVMGLPPEVPGTVVVQHIPEMFTVQFARRLNECCPQEVRLAETGDAVTPGVVLVAPGGRHTVLCSRGSRYIVEVRDGPAVHHQRPSVDVLFHSVAACAGPVSVGILLTGMGSDGARGLLAMRQAGARTFAQDEQSCVVFGMPREAIRLGAAETVVSLARMPQCIVDAISGKETRRPAAASLSGVEP